MEKPGGLISYTAFVGLALAMVLNAAPRADAQTVISQAGWTKASVDSEDPCCGNAYRGEKAFDGNASTFWHTVWSNGAPPPPHEIVINLNASHSINGFRYLPRQDGVPNGRIGQYEFYVSTDGATWGAAVASGTFANVATQQEVSFAPKTGSYVRLRALTEVEGRPYTSVAELNVLEVTPVTPPASTDAFGVGTVNVKRGAGGAVELWAAYTAKFGSPVSLNLIPTMGDTAGGTFRFSCSDVQLVCEVSLAGAVMGPTPGINFLVYPRILIHRQDFQGSQVSSYCEYGDGATSANAGLFPLLMQPPNPNPAFQPVPINIGGTADCPGTPDPTSGNVQVIKVGPGRYDVDVSFVFKAGFPG